MEQLKKFIEFLEENKDARKDFERMVKKYGNSYIPMAIREIIESYSYFNF